MQRKPLEERDHRRKGDEQQQQRSSQIGDNMGGKTAVKRCTSWP